MRLHCSEILVANVSIVVFVGGNSSLQSAGDGHFGGSVSRVRFHGVAASETDGAQSLDSEAHEHLLILFRACVGRKVVGHDSARHEGCDEHAFRE